jgi:hypothetical protein
MPFYAKKRGIGKKRNYKRKGARRAKLGKAIKSFVKAAIHRNAENKVWVNYAANISLATASPSTVLPSISLLPTPVQGTGHGQRIGNEVRIVKNYIKGYINLLPYNAITNFLSAPIMVKMWIASYKLANNPNTAATATFSSFFEINNSSAPPQGTMLDMVLTTNKEVWTVHKTKTFEIGASSFSSTGPVGSGAYFDNSKMTLPYYFNLTKYTKSLKFDDGTTLQTNKNLFILFQCVNADGTAATGPVAETHFCHRCEYEDS